MKIDDNGDDCNCIISLKFPRLAAGWPEPQDIKFILKRKLYTFFLLFNRFAFRYATDRRWSFKLSTNEVRVRGRRGFHSWLFALRKLLAHTHTMDNSNPYCDWVRSTSNLISNAKGIYSVHGISMRDYLSAIFAFPSNSEIWFKLHLKRDAIRITQRTSISIKFIQFWTKSAICGERARPGFMRNTRMCDYEFFSEWFASRTSILPPSYSSTFCITINWNLPQININTKKKRNTCSMWIDVVDLKGLRAMWCALGIAKSAIYLRYLSCKGRETTHAPMRCARF